MRSNLKFANLFPEEKHERNYKEVKMYPFTPPRPSEISMNNWRAKVKPDLTQSHEKIVVALYHLPANYHSQSSPSPIHSIMAGLAVLVSW